MPFIIQSYISTLFRANQDLLEDNIWDIIQGSIQSLLYCKL